MKGILNNSIFSRLVITFLIMMIPIYLLGIYVYFWAIHSVKTEISNSMITQVSYYLNSLEKEIESIKILQYDCLSDENLNKLAFQWEIMEDYDKIYSMKQLRQRLVTIRNSSPFIKDVTAHISPSGKSISANDSINSIEWDKFKNIRVQQDVTGAQIIRFKDELFLTTLNENRIVNNSPLFAIEIELNQEELISNLEQLNTYADGGVILVNLFSCGNIIKQTDEKLNLSINNILTNIQEQELQGIELLENQQKEYYIAYAKSDYLNIILLKYVPKEYVIQPLKKINIWIWIFSLVSICIFLIYSYSTYKYMHKPLSRLVSAFRKVEQGDLEVSIVHGLNDEFGYLYSRFNDMVKKIKVLIEQVYKQKILTQRAELKQLQSQINPHFLYNSFFLINTMARVGDDNLIIFTKRLGEYFRFVTRNNSDNIPLKDEVNHARVYTEIQQMRFSKRLSVTFESMPEKYNELIVPRLILQPIVENAFEHSIEKKKSGIISIGFLKYDLGLDIIVEDNGDDMTDELINRLNTLVNTNNDYSETTGLININRRVKLMFGSDSGVNFYRSKLGGAKVVLSIRTGGSDL